MTMKSTPWSTSVVRMVSGSNLGGNVGLGAKAGERIDRRHQVGEPFLRTELRQPLSLDKVRVVVRLEGDIQGKATLADQPTHELEGGVHIAHFQSGDGGLGRAGSSRQLGLTQTRPPAGLPHQTVPYHDLA